jgi:hypothetical protein
MSTRETLRGMGPGAYTKIAEIMSGRAISQQGLVTTCKDRLYRAFRKQPEGFGLAHGLVVARKVG